MRSARTIIVLGSILVTACGGTAGSPPDASVYSNAASVTSADPALTFQGYAHEGPDLETGLFDIREPQLFITDADACDGGIPTRTIAMDLYAYALPHGAVPGTYPILNMPLTEGAFSTFNSDGFTIHIGTLNLTQIDSSVAIGSFDAQVTSVDGGLVSVHGTFSAPFCGGINRHCVREHLLAVC